MAIHHPIQTLTRGIIASIPHILNTYTSNLLTHLALSCPVLFIHLTGVYCLPELTIRQTRWRNRGIKGGFAFHVLPSMFLCTIIIVIFIIIMSFQALLCLGGMDYAYFVCVVCPVVLFHRCKRVGFTLGEGTDNVGRTFVLGY
jgi:hypothetical protein